MPCRAKVQLIRLLSSEVPFWYPAFEAAKDSGKSPDELFLSGVDGFRSALVRLPFMLIG